MSPLLSWLVFGIVAIGAIGVYFAASAWLDRRDAWIGELIRSAQREQRTWTDPADPQVRIFGGPYDHQAHGDFE